MKVNAFKVGFLFFYLDRGLDNTPNKCYTFFVMKNKEHRNQKIIEKKGKFLIMEYSNLTGRNLEIIKVLDNFADAKLYLSWYKQRIKGRG